MTAIILFVLGSAVLVFLLVDAWIIAHRRRRWREEKLIRILKGTDVDQNYSRTIY